VAISGLEAGLSHSKCCALRIFYFQYRAYPDMFYKPFSLSLTLEDAARGKPTPNAEDKNGSKVSFNEAESNFFILLSVGVVGTRFIGAMASNVMMASSHI